MITPKPLSPPLSSLNENAFTGPPATFVVITCAELDLSSPYSFWC